MGRLVHLFFFPLKSLITWTADNYRGNEEQTKMLHVQHCHIINAIRIDGVWIFGFHSVIEELTKCWFSQIWNWTACLVPTSQTSLLRCLSKEAWPIMGISWKAKTWSVQQRPLLPIKGWVLLTMIISCSFLCFFIFNHPQRDVTLLVDVSRSIDFCSCKQMSEVGRNGIAHWDRLEVSLDSF